MSRKPRSAFATVLWLVFFMALILVGLYYIVTGLGYPK